MPLPAELAAVSSVGPRGSLGFDKRGEGMSKRKRKKSEYVRKSINIPFSGHQVDSVREKGREKL